MTKKVIITIVILTASNFIYKRVKRINFNSNYEVGQPIDSLNNVTVFFNGGVDNVVQRNTKDGYNLGLEYQCIEFVKRYYYEHYNHKMPDSYGHAINFYNNNLLDGEINKQRNLTQYSNPSQSKPEVGDLLIMKGTFFNKYGHVAIISEVMPSQIEIIQQNPGPYAPSIETFELIKEGDKWKVKNERILGWLRK